MNSIRLLDFIARSLGVGVTAWLLILTLRQSSHRVRIAVVMAAWAMLAVLTVDWVVPMPRVQVWQPSGVAISEVPVPYAGKLLIGVWLLGAALAVGREIVGAFRLRRMVRCAEPIHEAAWIGELESGRRALGISMPVELRWSDLLGPCAAGWLHPVILLPRAASDWTSEMRAQVLIHELAHFRGRDLWMLIAVRLIAAVHWFNPFAITLRRCLEAEREQECDSYVVQLRGDAVAYARSLVNLAATPQRSRAVPALALLPRRRSQIENRIRALLQNDRTPKPERRWFEAVLVSSAVLLLVACSVTGPVSSPNDRASMEAEVELRLTADPFPGE